MILGHTGRAIADGDENIRGFQVTMDDALSVSVCDSVTNRGEQFQPLSYRQPVSVAVLRDRRAGGRAPLRSTALGRRARIEDSCDVGVAHQREGLAFGVESR
jgi:hypothetical protein